jgi:hypothetical protein
VGVLSAAGLAGLAYLAAEDPHEGMVLFMVGPVIGEFAIRFDFQRDEVESAIAFLMVMNSPSSADRRAMRGNSLVNFVSTTPNRQPTSETDIMRAAAVTYACVDFYRGGKMQMAQDALRKGLSSVRMAVKQRAITATCSLARFLLKTIRFSWTIAAWKVVIAALMMLALTNMPGLAAARPGRSELMPAARRPVSVAKLASVAPADVVSAGRQPRSMHLAQGVRQICAAPRPGQAQCMALLRTDAHGGASPDQSRLHAYNPANLESAYKLTRASDIRGLGETVAVVDAYKDPNAARDLAVYRNAWKLPACDNAAGAGCVTVVNERGTSHRLPTVDPTGGWELEESLDMDMVSAICPNCHILLVEARSPMLADLGKAEDTAVRLGAKFVSDSWGGAGDVTLNHYFNHPGVAITVAAGDDGLGTYYPASTQFVTSVGGTTLVRAKRTARGWSDRVWSAQPGLPDGATTSGCSFDPNAGAKPSWQTVDNNAAHGCRNRTDNDVAAVADPNTPVWSYDSYPYRGKHLGWNPVGGTSAASPIIAGIYALAGTPRPGTYPASYLYQPGHAAELFKVTKGSNGYCAPVYLCDASHDYPGTSYNAPAGWGTPDGTAAFTDSVKGHTITVINPGTQDCEAGAKLKIHTSAVDSVPNQARVFSAAGLPRGVHINEDTGTISGRLTDRSGSSVVTVTATDSSGASGSVSFDIVAVRDLRTAYRRVTGQVRLVPLVQGRKICLYDAGDRKANGTKVEVWPCGRKSAERWTYLPDASPDSDGTLLIHGKCATIKKAGPRHARRVQLENCTGAPSQEWTLQLGTEWLANLASNSCMEDPGGSTRKGTWVGVAPCEIPPRGEEFILPPGPVLSAVRGTCLNDPHNSEKRVQADARPCNGGAAQKWAVFSNASQGQHNHLCLGMKVEAHGEPAMINGALAELESCDLNSQYEGYSAWFPLPDGMVQNFDSLLCLDNLGPGKSKVVAAPCYGTAGEIWAEG